MGIVKTEGIACQTFDLKVLGLVLVSAIILFPQKARKFSPHRNIYYFSTHM